MLFFVAFTSIMKLLLITVLGALLAHHRFNILRENATKHINAVSIIFLGFIILTVISFLTKFYAK